MYKLRIIVCTNVFLYIYIYMYSVCSHTFDVALHLDEKKKKEKRNIYLGKVVKIRSIT